MDHGDISNIRETDERTAVRSDADAADRRRILIVDDDEGCRTFLAEAFDALGCRTVRAADAGEALRLASEAPLDLVCSDLRMPGMDGLEFLELLRAHAPGLPCAVVSGCDDAAAQEAAKRAGVVAYLRKPVSVVDLENILRILPREPRPFAPLDPRLLHKTTQLSALAQFSSRLREPDTTGMVGSSGVPGSASSTVVQRSVETVRRAVGSEIAVLYLVDDGTIRPVAACGGACARLPVEEIARRFHAQETYEAWHGILAGVPIVAAPLLIQGEPIGILCAARSRATAPFAWSDAELVGALAGQTAAALENASMGRQLEQAFQSSVASLVVMLEAKHKYTEGHSLRVAEYAQGIAATLGLPAVEHEQVRTAAILHDLGKVGVRDDVLDKQGALTPEEWGAMRQHPLLGGRILGSLEFLASEARIVRHHHERVDGMGYPDGLYGEAIPLAARIIAVADAYDAMRSTRSYRPSLPHVAALAELRRGAGSQFDARAVAAFASWADSRAGQAAGFVRQT